MKNLVRDFTTNTAALDDAADDPLLRPVSLPMKIDDVANRIVAWAEQTPRWSLESRQSNESEIQIHLLRTTRLFRFVDDIQVSLTAEGDSTRVDARSQSRLGKGDLGQNPRNLKELTQMLKIAGSVERAD